jgi:hypothetical protein
MVFGYIFKTVLALSNVLLAAREVDIDYEVHEFVTLVARICVNLK